MKIERFEIPGLAQYSYVLSANGEAVVIDPIRDIDRYVDYAASQGLVITYILETHIHADFASGSTALAHATGAELALSAHDEGERYIYEMPHRPLRDRDSIQVGSVRIEALHTPGHTPEHLSFVVFDGTRSATEPVALFSGDFLFVGSLGRPDLLGEEATLGLAHELYHSLHERIVRLPDHVEVYPGHGAGSFCGAGMSDRAVSTLGYERVTNPLFQLDCAGFVEAIVESVPEMPDYYPRMKALNAKGAAVLNGIPGGVALSTARVAEMAEQGAIVLDVRRPEFFGCVHIPGAINIGAGLSLSLWAGWLLDSDKDIVVVSDGGDDEDSRRALIRVGLDRVAGFLAGGMPAWIDSGRGLARTTQLSTEELALNPAAVIVDVRTEKEWETGHLEGALNIPLGALMRKLALLPAGRRLITVCGSGYRSSIAASLLARRSIAQVSNLAGGMVAWNYRRFALCAD